MGLSVIIIVKNEAKDLPQALDSVSFADEVIVLDSGSTDGTQQIAKNWGAKVFETVDWPGFGPQKNRALEQVTQDWVLSLDADEWIEPDLAENIKAEIQKQSNVTEGKFVSAFRFNRRSIFIDRIIRFGDWRRDRVVRLFRRGSARFTNDLVHERLLVDGAIRQLDGSIGHFSVRSIEDSRSKMWQYNQLAALRLADTNRGGFFIGIIKAGFCLFRGLILRAGFLDGQRGLQLAWLNAHGTFLRYALAQSFMDQKAYRNRTQSALQRFRDIMNLVFVDHGFLRMIYDNRSRLPGGLYRTNQPGPLRLASYKRRFGIKTVINLRGCNHQCGWYRLEERTCQVLGLKLINTQIYSRGLVGQERLAELRSIIEEVELPALVHCKSGADRAGFFSVLYRHYRLGEPIEFSTAELSMRYGHFRSAKTGVLDYFFEKFLALRGCREGFRSWICSSFNPVQLQSSFRPNNWSEWVNSRLLKRE